MLTMHKLLMIVYTNKFVHKNSGHHDRLTSCVYSIRIGESRDGLECQMHAMKNKKANCIDIKQCIFRPFNKFYCEKAVI
jgi:hypothetical protein